MVSIIPYFSNKANDLVMKKYDCDCVSNMPFNHIHIYTQVLLFIQTF